MVPELFGFFRCEIFLFGCLEVFFHLPDNVFGLMEVLHVEICRSFPYFVRMAAGRAKFPLLESVDIHKLCTPRAADNGIHNSLEMSACLLKTYRKNLIFCAYILYIFFALTPLKCRILSPVKRNAFIAGNADREVSWKIFRSWASAGCR